MIVFYNIAIIVAVTVMRSKCPLLRLYQLHLTQLLQRQHTATSSM